MLCNSMASFASTPGRGRAPYALTRTCAPTRTRIRTRIALTMRPCTSGVQAGSSRGRQGAAAPSSHKLQASTSAPHVLWPPSGARHHASSYSRGASSRVRAKDGDDERNPDWEKEMSMCAPPAPPPAHHWLPHGARTRSPARVWFVHAWQAAPACRPRACSFNRRISAPNQLETLRELESNASVGKVGGARAASRPRMHAHARSALERPCARARQVVFQESSLAIISGLNSDAPLGTKISFVTGATGCGPRVRSRLSWAAPESARHIGGQPRASQPASQPACPTLARVAACSAALGRSCA